MDTVGTQNTSDIQWVMVGVPQLRHAEDHWGQLNRVYPEIPCLIHLNHEYPIKMTISWGINPYKPYISSYIPDDSQVFWGLCLGWTILANQTGSIKHGNGKSLFIDTIVFSHTSLKLLMFNCHVWLPEGTVFVGFKFVFNRCVKPHRSAGKRRPSCWRSWRSWSSRPWVNWKLGKWWISSRNQTWQSDIPFLEAGNDGTSHLDVGWCSIVKTEHRGQQT